MAIRFLGVVEAVVESIWLGSPWLGGVLAVWGFAGLVWVLVLLLLEIRLLVVRDGID